MGLMKPSRSDPIAVHSWEETRPLIRSMFSFTLSNVSRSPRGFFFEGPSCIQ
jgi:hypothetical protein